MNKNNYMLNHRVLSPSMSGFTLIELVIVIVILGILAVTALPRYIDLQADATTATLEGVEGAIKSTSNLVTLKAKVEGVDNGDITVGDDIVPIVSGYMEGRGQNAFLKVIDASDVTPGLQLVDECPTSFCIRGFEATIADVTGATGGHGVYFWPQNYAATDDCYAYYYNKEDGSEPLIGKIITGC